MALDINRLKLKELQYELAVRGGPTVSKVDEARTLLRDFLKKEASPEFVPPTYPYTFEEDFEATAALVDRLNERVATFDDAAGGSSYLNIVTSLLHADQRLFRTKNFVTLSADEWAKIRTLQDEIKKTRENLDLKAFKFNESIQVLNVNPTIRKHISSSPIGGQQQSVSDMARDMHFGTTPSKTLSVSSTPIFKWGLKFSGDGKGDTLNSFLDSVERMARSRGVDQVTLFETAYDLFEGPGFYCAKPFFHRITMTIS